MPVEPFTGFTDATPNPPCPPKPRIKPRLMILIGEFSGHSALINIPLPSPVFERSPTNARSSGITTDTVSPGLGLLPNFVLKILNRSI